MVLPVYSFLHSASHLINFVNIYSQPVMNRMIWRCQGWIRNNSCPEFSYMIYLNKTNSKRKDTITLKVVVAVQLLSCVWLFVTSWTAAHQASLSITISWSLFKFMSIESVMLSNHLTLCHPLLLLPSFFPNIRVFSNKSALCIRWPKYWSLLLNKNNYLSIFLFTNFNIVRIDRHNSYKQSNLGPSNYICLFTESY